MSKLSKLVVVSEEEKQAVLRHYNLTEKDFEEKVEKLKEWISKSNHLPQDEGNDNKIINCLVNGKMNIERAKQSIEGYFRVRTLYSDEFFDKLLPDTREYQLGKKYVQLVMMPKLTPDLLRVGIYKLRDPEGEAEDAFLYEVLVMMMAELKITHKDFFLSNTFIIDYGSCKLKNMIKFTPTFNWKMVNILNALNLRIHSVHMVNIPNFFDQIMTLVKMFLPAKIVSRIHAHKTYESLYEHIPRESLPSNFGGTERSIEELYDEWCEQIEESEDFFKNLLTLKSTEKPELDPTQQDLFGMGVEGSFKKLAVD